MVITPHATIGAALGSRAPGLASAFAAGLLSHYCLDAIPHRDYSLAERHYLAADAATALLLVFAYKTSKKASLGALGGITPDLIEFGLPKQRLSLMRRLHLKSHSSKTAHPVASAAIQVSIVGLALALRKR